MLLANIVGFLDGSILPVLGVPGKPVDPGLFRADTCRGNLSITDTPYPQARAHIRRSRRPHPQA